MDDLAGASSPRQEYWYGLLLTVAVPEKQVCSPVGDRCDQIMNDVCQFRSLVDYCVGYLVILSDTKDTTQCLHVKRLDPVSRMTLFVEWND